MTTAFRRLPSLRDPVLLALVGLPAVGAVTTLVATAYLTSWDLVTESVGSVVFVIAFGAWALLPFAAAVAVGASVRRYWRGATSVVLLGDLLLIALTAWVLWSIHTSESSTAVLGLLYAPLLQLALAGVTMVAAVGVAKLRRRRTARTL
ncbi:hypothetical protein AB2L28_13645 [Kineococcus sp. TBRC 1896]|uniref:Uncharacterized protein n=1 Tax=Kineococcus mangrovi TaxID=1660183 RepID=A0ABV4I3M0_9ACTN